MFKKCIFIVWTCWKSEKSDSKKNKTNETQNLEIASNIGLGGWGQHIIFFRPNRITDYPFKSVILRTKLIKSCLRQQCIHQTIVIINISLPSLSTASVYIVIVKSNIGVKQKYESDTNRYEWNICVQLKRHNKIHWIV